ncbi:MAG: hypothetical protein WCT53_02835 [Candidatus Gracilibacteria bacterium]
MFGLVPKQQLAEAGEREAALKAQVAALEAKVAELTAKLKPLEEAEATRVAQQQAETAAAALKAAAAAEENSPESLIKAIASLNPDTFPSKEAARAKFTELVVQYWNTVKPEMGIGADNAKIFDGAGLNSRTLPYYKGGFLYVTIPDSFYDPTDEPADKRECNLILRCFGGTVFDAEPIYTHDEKMPARARFSQTSRIITPAKCRNQIIEFIFSERGLSKPDFIRAGGVPGACE